MVQTNSKKFIEIAQGSPSHRGTIISSKELSYQIKLAQKNRAQLYRSVFYFDDEILEHMKIYKTVRSYAGKFYVDNLIFDIDRRKGDADEFTLLRAKNFVSELLDNWKLNEEQISIWFSGSGYHITTQDFFGFNPDANTPDSYKATLMNYFPEADEKIYIRTGLIRVGNTINTKTGLYKINIPYADFTRITVEEVKELASKPRKTLNRINNVPTYPNLIIKGLSPTISKVNSEQREQPTKIITCAQKIFLEGSLEGRRHVNLVSMVSVFRRQGIPYEGVLTLARDWNSRGSKLEDYELEKQTRYIWDRGYTPSCNDKVLSLYCDSKCIHYKHKDLSIEILNSKMLESHFAKWAIDNDTEKAFDFNELYNIGHQHRIYPREFVYLQGDTGVGKSVIIMNWMIALPRFKVLYISNEVGQELFYRRMIQIAHVMKKEEVISRYRDGSLNELATSIEHIDTMFRGTTFMDLKKKVAENQYQIVVIDVIDKMKVSKEDYVAKTDILAIELMELASAMNIIIVGVHHISKFAANQTSLNVHSGKGSAALEQNASQVFSLLGQLDNPTRFLRSEKARDENQLNVTLFYDTDTYKMMEV